jgi:hypothetical protein
MFLIYIGKKIIAQHGLKPTNVVCAIETYYSIIIALRFYALGNSFDTLLFIKSFVVVPII